MSATDDKPEVRGGHARPLVRVNIESPLSAPTPAGMAENVAYARACLLDSLSRGEAPFAMHLLYPQVLDDTKPYDRAKGIAAGCALIAVCQVEAAYFDRGFSGGMRQGMEVALRHKLVIEFRSLHDRPRPTDQWLHQEKIPHTWEMCTVCTGHRPST